MKILNKSEKTILEVTDKNRIKKLLGYPDKFEKVEDEQPSYFRNDNKKNNKKDDSKKDKVKEEVKPIENENNDAILNNPEETQNNLEDEQPSDENFENKNEEENNEM